MRTQEEILQEILKQRGIISSDDVSEFLAEKPKKTYDPFLLHNMEAGVDLLLSEIKAGSRICIYGDYDADGVTSICILSHVIGMLTDNFTYYIPSRFEEGYGLNKDAITAIREAGTDLLITVDCGSVSYEEVEYAKELGMKVIVTDHHSIDDIKADCILINPKQKECQYPFKELAGCGVAFKMAQALRQKADLPKVEVNKVLDLAAVGTVGDVVSLTDENRTIVKYGLNKINAGSRIELKLLMEAISLHHITSENIAFGIAPHINAAGRMASAKEAVELFTANDMDKARKQVQKLVDYNAMRKKTQENAYNHCMKMITGEENFILLKVEDIHEGIAGIVAGKIKEETDRPVIIMTPSGEGYLKGTGRSVEEIDIYRLLKSHSALFARFGGHKSACGFLMPEENEHLLRKALGEDMERMLEENPYLLESKSHWDMELFPEEVTKGLAEELKKLEPCGQGNEKPVFIMKNVRLSRQRFMGEEGAHAAFTAVSSSGGRADCVFFKKAQEKKELIFGMESVTLTGRVELQSWRGKQSARYIVEEIVKCR